MATLPLLAIAVAATGALGALLGRALLNRTRYRNWPQGRTAVAFTLVANGTWLLILGGFQAAQWIPSNGLSWHGVCPGGPPDREAYLCTFDHFALHVASPFAMPIVGAATFLWHGAWCGSWTAAGSWKAASEPSGRLRKVGYSLFWGSVAMLLACAASVAIFLGILVMAGRPHAPGRTASSMATSEYLAAWGLPIRLSGVIGGGSVDVPRSRHTVVRSSFGLQDGDALRVLAHFPKQCWQRADALPTWLFDEREWDAPQERSPQLLVRPRSGQELVAVGVRPSGDRTAATGDWAGSFAEARRRLAAGEAAWEWVALHVDATKSRNHLSIEHRGSLSDLRDWKPICESDGAGVDAVLSQPTLYGVCRGVVEEEAAFLRRGPHRFIEGAVVSFEHENLTFEKQVTTDANGRYRADLPEGRHRVLVTHPDYTPYSTEPGWVVVEPNGKDHFFRVLLEPR